MLRTKSCLCRHHSDANWQGSTRWRRRTLRHRRPKKKWRSTPDDLEEREKRPKKAEKHSSPPYPRRKRTPLLRTGMSTGSGYELNLRHLHCRKTTSLHDHRDVQNRKNCTCGTFEHLHNKGIDHLSKNSTTTGMSTTLSKNWTGTHTRWLRCLKQSPDVAHNGHVNHLLQELHLWNLHGNDATATLSMN